jgi:hypothetical protein
VAFKRSLITEDGRFDEHQYTRRWAWFISTQLQTKKSLREVAERARLDETCIRRYGRYDEDARQSEAWGPKKIGETTRLVHALGFCPGKVAWCLRIAATRKPSVPRQQHLRTEQSLVLDSGRAVAARLSPFA